MSARVLLMRLSCRTSAKGAAYLSGFLGCARVVAFKSKDLDKFGNEQWEIYVSEPEPKNGDQSRNPPTRGQSTWDASREPRQQQQGREIAQRLAEPLPPWGDER